MKFKYKQKKPRALEEYLRGKKEDQIFGKCPNCGHIYNKDNNKKICTQCFSLLESIDNQSYPF